MKTTSAASPLGGRASSWPPPQFFKPVNERCADREEGDYQCHECDIHIRFLSGRIALALINNAWGSGAVGSSLGVAP